MYVVIASAAKARPGRRRPLLRTVGCALAGILVMMAPLAGHCASPGLNMGRAATGPLSGVTQVGDARGSNWHPAPGSGWRGPRSGPSRFNGGPYGWSGVPNYYIWVPGSAIFDYPFPDWQGPDGGWGNP